MFIYNKQFGEIIHMHALTNTQNVQLTFVIGFMYVHFERDARRNLCNDFKKCNP